MLKQIDQQLIFKTMVEFVHDAILLIDPYGIIIQVNPAAVSVCGFRSADEIQMQPFKFTDLFEICDLNNTEVSLAQRPVSRALTGEKVIDFKCRGTSKKSGKTAYWLYSAIPIFDETKNVAGVILSIKEDCVPKEQFEKELLENEERLRFALIAGSHGFYDFDISAGSAKVNDEYITILGYEPGELTIITFDWWIHAIHPDDREKTRSILEACVYGKSEYYKMEFRMRTKSGDWKWILCQGRISEYDKQGKPVRMLGTHTDITAQKQVEEALREEKNKLAKIAATLPGVIYSFRMRPDESAYMSYASPALFNVLGFYPEDVAKDMSPFFVYVHPDDLESVKESIFESARTLSPWHKEFRFNHTVKGEIWIEGSSVPQREADGSTIWYGFLSDITNRKRAEEALREEKNKLVKIAATLPGVIYSYREREDGSAYMPYASPALINVLGFNPEDVAKDMSQVFAAIHPDDIGPVKESIAESERNISPWHKEFRYNHPAKGEIWIGAQSIPQREADGGLIWYGFGGDITERKRAEEALRLSEEKFSKAFMTSPDSITITGKVDGVFIETNNGCKDVFGYTREEMIGHSSLSNDLDLWVNQKDRDLMVATLNAHGEVNELEVTFRRKDGSIVIGMFSARFIKMKGKDYILATVRDITEQKKTDEVRNRLTRELRALSSCNEALVRAENEQTLLYEICTIICDVAGYRLAWVGLIDHKKVNLLEVVAAAGSEKYFLTGKTYFLSDTGETPVDRAMQSKQSCITSDFVGAPTGSLWSDSAIECGCRSAIALPLLDDKGNPLGVLSIYSKEPNVFAAEEVKLLEELAADLSFGIVNLRTRVERGLAQKALAYEKKFSDALIYASPGIFLVLDRNGQLLRMNTNFVKLLGQQIKDYRSRNCLDFVYRDDYGMAKKDLERLPDAGHLEDDIRLEFKPGEISWWRLSAHAVNIAETLYLIVTGLDITSRKGMEDNLQKALKEKDVLLQELYHRTKNNMQVISAYLSMQAISLGDEKLQTIFNEMDNRIRAMALVHEKLYKSKDLTNINLQDYFYDLTKLLFASFPNTSGKIKLICEIEDVSVFIDIAIPIGLVVTELLTNSLKYAFPDSRSGWINLRVHKKDRDMYELDISDNGVGAPGTFDLE